MSEREKIIEAIGGLHHGDATHFSEWAAVLADLILSAPITSATVIKPGDRVLLTINERWSAAMTDVAEAHLAQRFPEAEFTFIAGVKEITVAPGGAPKAAEA